MFTRRIFLRLKGWVGRVCKPGSAMAAQPVEKQRSALLLGGGKYIDTSNNPQTTKFVLSIFDMAMARPRLIELSFLAHGIVFDPHDSQRLLMFEKIGPGACEVNLRNAAVTRMLRPHPERNFYGHGEFSRDGSLLYSTETYIKSSKGVIAIRDAKSLELLDEFPSYGDSPHDCHLIDDGEVMVISNGGGTMESGHAPCICYVDVASRKLLEKVEPSAKHINTGHLECNGNGNLVVVSAPRKGLEQSGLGGVSIRNGKHKKLVTMSKPGAIISRMKGEALSLSIHEANHIVGVTHPDGDMVTFWSVESGALLKTIDLSKPRGISQSTSQDRFIISYGSTASLMELDINTLQPVPDSEKAATYLTGSHIYNWDAKMRASST